MTSSTSTARLCACCIDAAGPNRGAMTRAAMASSSCGRRDFIVNPCWTPSPGTNDGETREGADANRSGLYSSYTPTRSDEAAYLQPHVCLSAFLLRRSSVRGAGAAGQTRHVQGL